MTKKVFAVALFSLLLWTPNVYGIGYNLADLINNNTELTIGDKIFYGFTFSATAPTCNSCSYGPTTAAGISVTPLTDDPFLPGIQFTGGMFVTVPSTSSDASATYDIQLGYWVRTVSELPLITDIHQAITAGGTGQLGTISVVETARGKDPLTNETVNSTVGFNPTDLSDPPSEAGENLYFSQPYKKVQVSKDVLMTAYKDGHVQISIIEQRISQVPEPGFYGALALGLSGLVLAFRRRSAAK